MAKKRIEIALTEEERKILEKYISKGKKNAREITRSRVLLLLDEEREIKDIQRILGISRSTIYNIRIKYLEKKHNHILDFLKDDHRSGRPIEIDSRVDANITMIACTDSPEGTAKWTLRMIADKMVKLDIVESISHESVRQSLKKTNLNPG